MTRIFTFLKLFMMDLLHGQRDSDKKIRKGFVLYFLGIALIFGVALPNMHQDKQKHTYDAWDYSNRTGLITVKNTIKHHENATIVLHRKGCGACEKAENDITGQLIKKQNERSKNRFIVMDIKKMSREQLRELSTLIPEIVTPRGIPTPLVANVKVSGNHLKFKQFSETSQSKDINKVFDSIK